MKRVMVTGSRTWDDVVTIRHALRQHEDPNGTVLVSGHCPDGADALAELIAVGLGWPIEPHPARWDRYGKRAGLIRNREMAQSHPDVCLAFWRDNSRGTQHAINACEKEGVPVVTYNYAPPVVGRGRR